MIKFINILKELGEISVTPYEYDYDKSKHKAFFTTEDGTKYIFPIKNVLFEAKNL